MQQGTTREGLLGSTNRKFLSNGYQKASLRTTCRNVGVTADVLYFFFRGRSALFHVLVKDVVEAVMQILYQHTGLEKEVYSNTNRLMGMEHDIRFTQELISFYYAHGTALEPLFNCSWGSACWNFTERIIAYLVKQNTKIISAMVEDSDAVFNACTLC